MRKISQILAIIASLAVSVSGFIPLRATAAELLPVSAQIGSWKVTTVARESADIRVEAYKLDRNLVAWTETNLSAGVRTLNAFDGVNVKTLAVMGLDEWNDVADAGFFDPVSGNFDVADGLVVWTKREGADREIFSWDGYEVRKVSDNVFDDKHPITSNGRVAWTSAPGSSYNLMVKDAQGVRRIDSWNVLNYAFSGDNLYWLNKRGNENWFRVFVNDGFATRPVGEGDDRSIRKYFFSDDKGTVAWEYSTKRWEYDKRVIYLSNRGADAVRMAQRDVPPNVTRIEDVEGSEVLFSSTDLLYTKYLESTSFISSVNGREKTLAREMVPVKARFMDGGYVRHVVPENSSAVKFFGSTQDFVSMDPVNYNVFDADGATAAVALASKGIVAFTSGKSTSTLIPTAARGRDIAVRNGDIAFIEGEAGSGLLRFATSTVLVKSNGSVRSVSGHLVKAAGSRAVYLAADDGKRYVFSGLGQFNGWYGADFSSVRTLSASKMSAMPLSGIVIFRPGYKLLKIATQPQLYAVGKDGMLHWVRSDEVAATLFGKDWQRNVETIDSTVVADYGVGSPIADLMAYQAAMYAGQK
jgi:hypothetical protein